MKRVLSRRVVVALVALLTLGSGIVNLLSVTGPPLPERGAYLRRIFPLEFIHFSRFGALLIGFALVVSSLNIYKRKQRAFYAVLLLSCLSVVLHLTKGLDYEEATLSLALIGLLLVTRKEFSVRSSIPDLRSGLGRLAIALGAALVYGVAGFWLLDTRHFGINFTIGDSIHRTLLFLSMIGDPTVIPRTRYAFWFVDSLYLMTSVTIIYSLFAVFRPVVYRYRTLPHERKLAETINAAHGRASLDYFKQWPDKTYFFTATQKSYVAYKVGAGYAMALGDPVGPEEEIEPAIRAFVQMTERNGWKPGFYQTLPDYLPIYKKLGFRRLKIGDDAIVDLTEFRLEGKQLKKERSKINQIKKQGVRFVEYQPPLSPEILDRLKEVSDAWLDMPGKRERTFTLGLFDPDYLRATPVYAALDAQDRMLAFVNVPPCFRRGEVTIDLMRHRPDAPPSIMDYVFTKLFLEKKQEGFTRFNMGMAPMGGFQEREEASRAERAVHYFMQRLNFLFNYQGLRKYKAKFATLWEPRYLIYRNVMLLPLVARAMTELSEVH